MAKTSVNFHIDDDLLANLKACATQTGCTIAELIERFCQQGLGMAPLASIPKLEAPVIESRTPDVLTTRLDALEMDFKSMSERLSLLESKVDLDIDVDDYLQNWQNSLELKIASLVDTLVEKRVEQMLGAARRLAELGSSEQISPASDVKPPTTPTTAKGLLDDCKIYSDDDDEPDEILTAFLEP